MRPLIALAAVAVVIALVAPDLIAPGEATVENFLAVVIQPATSAWTR